MRKTKAIIFDIDGTLWDATEPLAEIWNAIGIEVTGFDHKLTKEDLARNMGKPLLDILFDLFPDANEEEAKQICEQINKRQCAYLKEHPGKLYPGVIDLLNDIYELKEFDTYLVSNCENNYMDTFIETTHLGFYFVDSECYGNTRKPKKENIRMVIGRNRIEKAIYVGDTIHDYAAAKNAGVEFVHATYGFDPNFKSEYKINSPRELTKIIKELML